LLQAKIRNASAPCEASSCRGRSFHTPRHSSHYCHSGPTTDLEENAHGWVNLDRSGILPPVRHDEGERCRAGSRSAAGTARNTAAPGVSYPSGWCRYLHAQGQADLWAAEVQCSTVQTVGGHEYRVGTRAGSAKSCPRSLVCALQVEARPGGKPLDRLPRQGVLDPEGRVGRRHGASVAGRTCRGNGLPLRQSENSGPSRYSRDRASQSDCECPSECVLFLSEHANLLLDRLSKLLLARTTASSSGHAASKATTTEAMFRAARPASKVAVTGRRGVSIPRSMFRVRLGTRVSDRPTSSIAQDKRNGCEVAHTIGAFWGGSRPNKRVRGGRPAKGMPRSAREHSRAGLPS
jgi:hypothetical protein